MTFELTGDTTVSSLTYQLWVILAQTAHTCTWSQWGDSSKPLAYWPAKMYYTLYTCRYILSCGGVGDQIQHRGPHTATGTQPPTTTVGGDRQQKNNGEYEPVDI